MINEKSQERSSQMIQEEKSTNFNAIEELPIIQETDKLSKLLKEGRQKYGLKQKDIAARLSITPTVVNRIEAGTTTKPSERVLKGIAPYIGKGYSELLFIAGYSRVMQQEVFLNAKGEEIPYLKIVNEIYSADFELLEALEGIQSISYSNINIIKKLIYITKLVENDDIDTKNIKKKESVALKLFYSIINFLSSQLEALETLVNGLEPTSTTI